MDLDCLILAAGASTRFGRCKLLADWQGQPLLASIIAAARGLQPNSITVVGGAFYEDLAACTVLFATSQTPALELVKFESWHLGMGHSLAYGVSQLPLENAVLVLLGDQPLVSANDLQRLYDAWRRDDSKIVCANFAGTLGVPALFPAAIKPKLLQCEGDRGAKQLLQSSNDLTNVPMPTAAIDIDSPLDLQHLTTDLTPSTKE